MKKYTLLLAAGLLALTLTQAAETPAPKTDALTGLTVSDNTASFKIDPDPKISFSDPELQKLAGGKRMSELRDFVKEGVDAKNALAAAQTAAQQNAVVTEYYKAVAEKNQAIIEIVGLRQQLEAANKRIAELEAAAKPKESAK